MSMKANDKAPAVDLSTLLALARVRNKKLVNRRRVLDNLSTPWAKGLAEALIDDKGRNEVSDREAEDLHYVRQLAGIVK